VEKKGLEEGGKKRKLDQKGWSVANSLEKSGRGGGVDAAVRNGLTAIKLLPMSQKKRRKETKEKVHGKVGPQRRL